MTRPDRRMEMFTPACHVQLYRPPAGATYPLLVFLDYQHRSVHFVDRIIRYAEGMDMVVNRLNDALQEKKEPHTAFQRSIFADWDLISEATFARTVDNFLTFVSQTLGLLYKTRPEILRSVIQVKLEDILRFADRESIVKNAVDNYVRKLTYQSLRDLYREIKDRTGFRLFEEEARLREVTEAVAIRNVIVHNRGIVDGILARDVLEFSGKEGEHIGVLSGFAYMETLVWSAADIDRRARLEWGLPSGSHVAAIRCKAQRDAQGGVVGQRVETPDQ